MSSTSPTRRILIAAAAAMACLVPAACDYASASAPGRPAALPTPTHVGHQEPGTAPAGASKDPADADPTGTEDPTTDQATTDASATSDASASTDASATRGATTSAAAGGAGGAANNGLDVLARDCSKSKLTPHTGFQIAPACVSTAFGEVAAEDRDPSLLITDAPKEVGAKAPFTISVSTRNLVRDRFLGAAAGGYYLESSVLTDKGPNKGLQRGHFHTACRMLPNTNEAPDAAPVPAFFLATQDNGGGAKPDTVQISVPTGMPTAGTAQCTVWAGDGSHRIPMMQRANQTPAVDSVRITVR